MLSRVMAKANSTPDKAQARLSEITTREVSLVDRAANRRKFLVTKRDNMKTKLVADGNGGFTEVPVQKADNADDNKPTATDGAQASDKSGTDDSKESAEKTEKSIQQLGAVAERILTVAKEVKAGKGSIPDGFDKEVSKMLGEILKANDMATASDDFAVALEGLNKTLSELTEPKKDDTPAPTPAEKSDGDDKIASLEKQIQDLTTTVSKQAQTIKKLEDEPGPSNSRRAEDGGPPGDSEADNDWPMDMNAEPVEAWG